MGWWVRLYFEHTAFIMGSPVRQGWPDGLPIGRQPSLLVAVFDEIEAGVMQELKLDAK